MVFEKIKKDYKKKLKKFQNIMNIIMIKINL